MVCVATEMLPVRQDIAIELLAEWNDKDPGPLRVLQQARALAGAHGQVIATQRQPV